MISLSTLGTTLLLHHVVAVTRSTVNTPPPPSKIATINKEYLVLLNIISLQYLQIDQHNTTTLAKVNFLRLSYILCSQFPSIWGIPRAHMYNTNIM
jgi:hypothetical protein